MFSMQRYCQLDTVVATLVFVMFAANAARATSDISVAKSVMPEVIDTGSPVEFDIVVSNAGPDAALDVQLIDVLPAELQVPAGMAVSVSQGFYDVDSGEWTIGNVAAGTMATMSIPAELAGSTSPPCILNTASLLPVSGDLSVDDDSSTASVRRPGVDRCVDLFIENALFSVPQPFCNDVTTASLTVFIRNNGPDEARAVELSVVQSSGSLPDFGFSDSQCTGNRTSRCVLGTIIPGGLKVLNLASNEFNNRTAYTATFQIAVSGLDADYVNSDNTLSIVRQVPVTTAPPCDIPLPSIGGGGCFIATAAWGSPWNENVAALRAFRDRYLLTNKPGRALVEYYYRHSPPIAAHIADKPVLRALTRTVLTPFVITLRYPILVVLLMAMFGWLVMLVARTGSGHANGLKTGTNESV